MGKIFNIAELNYSGRIPNGYRELEIGEKIGLNDLYFKFNALNWIALRTDGLEYKADEKYIKNDSLRVITKDKEKKKVIYTKEDKENLIDKLRKNKAIYEDCAMKPLDEKESDLAETLAEEKLIAEFRGRFYIEA